MLKIILNFFFLVIVLEFKFTAALKSYTLDEEIKNCNENNGSKSYFEKSNLEFTALNDTFAVLNGKIKFLKQISSPWPANLYGERYDRGQWNLMFQRKLADFCLHVLNPAEFWYKSFKEFFKNKPCPYPAGYEVVFKDFAIDASSLILPPEWSGRWRFTAEASLGKHPGHYECLRFYADIYD